MREWVGRHGRLLLVLAVVGVAAFQLGRVLIMERSITGGEISLPLDDSFIYLQYSRAIAEGHPFVYTPGNAPTTGATSLWYPLLLLPPHLLGLRPELCIAWALALGVLAFVASALLLARLGARLGGPVGGALAILLFLASPHLLWGYLSGMEIGLYGVVLLGTLSAYLRERDTARFPTLRWWAFALAGARPEGAVLCFVFGLLAVWDRIRAARAPDGPRVFSVAVLLLFAAGALPFLVHLAVTGSLESTGSQAKSILAEPYAETRAEYLANTPIISRDIAETYASHLMLDARDRPIPRMMLPSAAGALLFLVLALRPRGGPWRGGLAILAVTGAGVVVNSIPVHWYVHLLRYQQGLLPVVLLLFGAGWGRLAWWSWQRWPRWIGAPVAAAAFLVPAAAWVPLLWQTNGEMIRFYGHNCENILHQQVRVGRWIDRNLPPKAIVGLNDAGAIAYYGRRSTVDLVGLTTAGFARVYRSGLGCLFEHLRRLPPERLPTYFAIYPEWFQYWRESGILGPEAFRAHLSFNTICGGADKIVYPASWIDVRPTDAPVHAGLELSGRRLVDSIDHAWLEDERRHEWRASPEAKDVLRRYNYTDRPRPLTDGGRIIRGREQFKVGVQPGKDLIWVMRTDAWYPTRLSVAVDGRPAGLWTFARSETAWIEPRFVIPGSLITRAEAEVTIVREGAGDAQRATQTEGRDYAPFHYWFYQ